MVLELMEIAAVIELQLKCQTTIRAQTCRFTNSWTTSPSMFNSKSTSTRSTSSSTNHRRVERSSLFKGKHRQAPANSNYFPARSP